MFRLSEGKWLPIKGLSKVKGERTEYHVKQQNANVRILQNLQLSHIQNTISIVKIII